MKKKLLITAVTLVTGITTSAQIIYTDVNPDIVYAGTGTINWDIDLDNNDYTDFFLETSEVNDPSGLIELFAIEPNTGNSAKAITTGSGNFTAALLGGNDIGGITDFIATQTTIFLRAGGTIPPQVQWNNVTDRYLGLKFTIGSNTHYGWARLSTNGDNWTLKDYAYESTPDVAIDAGQMPETTSLNGEMDLSSNVKFLNLGSDAISVQFQSEMTDCTIDLVTVAGQQVASINVSSDLETIDVSALPSGLYLINVRTAQGTITKKFSIQ